MVDTKKLEFHEADLNRPYNGNSKIKAAGSSTALTPERAEELMRCYTDPIYFCKTYLKIITTEEGNALQPFVPRPYQERAIKAILKHRFTILKQGRQSGKTSTTAAVMLWSLIFNKEYKIACLAQHEKQAIDIVRRVKTYFENLPLWMQVGVVNWNAKTIELEDDRILFAAATSSGSVRGQTLNMVFADEFDIIEANLQEEFYTGTFPTISSGQNTKFIIASTPKGFKMFYKIWTEATDNGEDKIGSNGFFPISINWWDVPGRDEAWAVKERKRMGSESKFNQEYAATFEGSSNTLIAGSKLKSIKYSNPVSKDANENLHLFELPQPKTQYVISADVAEGVEGDSSTFVIIDVSKTPYRVVGTYVNDMIDTMMFPNVIFDLAQYYNKAFVIVESNAIGGQVLNILHYDLEYENLLTTNTKSKKDDITEGPSRTQLGIKQTKRTKHLGTSNLKTLVENDQLEINDFRIFYELSRFVRKGSSFAAEKNEHDDLVMPLVTFAYITTLDMFKELTGTDIRNSLNNQKLFEQENMPLGLFNNNFDDSADLVKEVPMTDFDRWMMS